MPTPTREPTLNEVLVVIGSGGMGSSIAHRIGAGKVIVLADVRPEQLAAAAEQLSGDGHRVLTFEVDVTSRRSVAALAEFADDAGPVMKVAHTAGLSPEQASAEAVLAVDLVGVALVLEEFERVICPGGAGVVISSMAGHMYPPFDADVERQLALTPADELLGLEVCSLDVITSSQVAYPFAKRANLVRVAAAAPGWGSRGARINSISPGVIATAMGRQELAGPSGQLIQAMIDASPAGRLGTPDDIAAIAELLLGPSAAFITGTDVLVDGGATAAIRSGVFEQAGVEIREAAIDPAARSL